MFQVVDDELLIHRSLLGQSDSFRFDGDYYHSGDLINVSNFAKGIYFVQIHVDGFVHQQKLLIE